MKKIYKLFWTAAILLLITNTVYSQQYYQSFDGFTGLRGWYAQNNTFPQTNEGVGWANFGPKEGYIGPESGHSAESALDFLYNSFGGTLMFSTVREALRPFEYNYASVGYSQNDYDDASISKWLISPVLKNLKNGDQIKFKTRARFVDPNDRLSAFLAQDANGLLDCDRPNKLEVRLSLNADENAVPNVGATPYSYGDFDRVLLTINPDLTKEGYPTGWTEYTITIKDLPPGQSFNGRIGFWYHFDHGGYNNCRTRWELPEPANTGLAVASEFGKEELSTKAGYVGLFVAAEQATIILDKAENQKGYNGTYIAIDDFQYLPLPVYVNEAFTNYVYYPGAGNGHTVELGYTGTASCYSSTLPPFKTFLLKNYGDAAVTVFPSIEGGSHPTNFKVTPSGATSVQPGESLLITVEVRDSLYASTGTGSLIVRNNSAVGAILGSVNLSYTIKSVAPVAKCISTSLNLTLNSSGEAKINDPKLLDNGSSISCGMTSGLQFTLSKSQYDFWGQASYTFGCGEVGANTLYLVVKQIGSTKDYSTCPVTVNVASNLLPQMDCSHSQTYYLSSNEKSMPLNVLVKPSITSSQCPATVTPISFVDLLGTRNGSLSSFGAGTYQVSWEAKTAAGNVSNCTTALIVTDTIKPKALCKDTAYIGYTYEVPGVSGYALKDKIVGKDLDFASKDNTGIAQYYVSAAWNGNTPWSSTGIPFTCSDAGTGFPISLKVVDGSGNSATCASYVKITSPSQPKCKNIAIDLDPSTGTKNIGPNDLLISGGNGFCGITNASVSRLSFSCSDVNRVIPVTVSYLDATNATRSCVSQVSVNQYSQASVCTDTVKSFVAPNELEASPDVGPVLKSACSAALAWTLNSSGVTTINETITGNTVRAFQPGISYVTRTTTYLDTTYQCAQVYAVYDIYPPIVLSTPSNQLMQFPSLSNGCTYQHTIVNPFQQGSYSDWSYTMSGATTESKTFNYKKGVDYYQDKPVNLNPGITNIIITAIDLAGNQSSVSYSFNLQVQNLATPFAYSQELQTMNTIVGNFCGVNYEYKISSPLSVPCNQKDYRWYYEIKDDGGNIVYKKDSIPQDSGAVIPIRISPFYNQYYPMTVNLGYHTKSSGSKVFNSTSTVSVRDSINTMKCPSNVTVQNTNNTTFTYAYTVNPPEVNLCPGDYWGFSVSGATTYATAVNPSVVYNSNQQTTLNSLNVSDIYPSLAYNAQPVVQLNPGENIIKFRILEESGSISIYGTECSYTVTVEDVSMPQMTCPADAVLHRSSASSCDVAITGTCQQTTGFTGPFGKTGLKAFGGNSRITLDKTTAPASIKFTSTQTFQSYNDSYIILSFNCSGTVSFNWEYKSSTPQFFRPFYAFNSYDPNAFNQTALTGFNISNTEVQAGTFSKAVNAGDILLVGLSEGGSGNGYLKLSNFSAPYFDPSTLIAQPVFVDQPALYFESDIAPNYSIGNDTIYYTLVNINNGNTATCVQQIKIIDDFASTLNCSNATVYLNTSGTGLLNPSSVLSTCFPVSSTTLSKDHFNSKDIGVQNVVLTSIDQSGTTRTCNINVTVLDTIKPIPSSSKLTLSLDPSGNVVLSQSAITGFFYDNCSIASVSVSQTNFSCSDVGTNFITITASDSSGNSNSAEVTVEVYPSGFNIHDPDLADTICTGSSKQLVCQSGSVDNPLSYQWQVREKNNAPTQWNLFTCTDDLPILPQTDGHKFFRLNINNYHDDTYMAYMNVGSADIHFKVLNPNTQSWDPVFKTLPRANSSMRNFYFIDAFNTNHVPYVLYLDAAGAVKMYMFVNDQWTSAGDDLYLNNNLDFNNLFFENGYFYPVKYNGKIYSGKETEPNNGSSYNLPIYQGTSFTTIISNAGKVVCARNTNNQNMVYELNVNQYDIIIGRDSLTDPTDNSSLFAMKSFRNEAYIAYESSNGKACVKKYNGSNTWSNVGALDFSTGQIFKLDLGVVNDTLYIIYVEASDHIVVKKYNGSAWVEMVSPSDNNTMPSINDIKFYDIAAVPSFYIDYYGAAHYQRLLRNDGWKNITNAGNSTYFPNTTVPSDNEYRCIASKYNCASTISGIKRLVVKAIPNLSVRDTAIVGANTVTLVAKNNTGTIYWTDIETGGPILGTGTNFTTPSLSSSKVFYAYAQNEQCYSDTVAAHVDINDVTIIDYHVIYNDSICNGEGTSIRLDTAVYGFKYSLYEKDVHDKFSLIDGPAIDPVFNIAPTQTTDYKIKVEESADNNAAQMYFSGDPSTEYFDFGKPVLSITNSVTIEAWMFSYAGDAKEALGLVFSNGGINDPSTTRNWEWSNGFFNVYNGNTVRQLAFPPVPTQWLHVATTAGPDGLAIYYNGVLVASSNDASSVNINNVNAELKFGVDLSTMKPSMLAGVDEFRVWNTTRTAAEVAANVNTCLYGIEQGLLIYNDFSKYNPVTKTFSSVTGNDAVGRNHSNYVTPQMLRDSSCTDELISERFLPAFTVNVLNGQTKISYIDGDYYSSANFCGGEIVKLVAHASSGNVSWYNKETGGTILGTGDTLSVFFDKDTVVYAQPPSACARSGINVDVVAYPKVLSTKADTICVGDYLYDTNPDAVVSNDANSFNWFDAPTGGNEIDPNNYFQPIMNSDTLWAEAYNDYCVGLTRVPVYIIVRTPKVISYKDTTLCGEGSATLHAIGVGGFVEWYDEFSLLDTGTVFTTPNLTATTHYYVDVNAGNDCYSDVQDVFVNVNSIPMRKDTIIACGPYTWVDGNTYTQSDTGIVYHKHNATGCDSILHLNLTIISAQNESVAVGQNSVCSGGSTTITVASPQLGYNYTLRDTSTNAVVAGPIVGSGANIVFNTGPLTNTRGYIVMLDKTISNSTQTVTCSIQIGPNIRINVGQLQSVQNAYSCSSYIWHGQTYTSSGTYYDTLTAASGCDSMTVLNLTIFKPVSFTETVTACGSYTWHGTTYTSSTNTPTWTGTTPVGCDSLVRLNLTIYQSSTADTSATACGSFLWNGSLYTASGSYTKTFVSVAGCDSTVTLHLTIKQLSTGTDIRTACGSFTWINGITYTSSNNTATYVLTNANGCDSTVTLQLTIRQPVSGSESRTSCNSYTWNGITYTVSGTYVDTLVAANGCDSIATLSLVVVSASDTTIAVTACDNYLWNGTIYTTSGQYSYATNCGTSVTLNLTVKHSTSAVDTVIACGSYTWIDGKTYTSNTTATYLLTNAAGCDSVLTLHLTINPVPNTSTTLNGTIITSNATGVTYQWLDCNNGNTPLAGQTNQSLNVTASGNYAVVVSNGICSDTSACVIVSMVTAVPAHSQANVRVYPNPTRGNIFVELDQAKDVDITVKNVLGHTIGSKAVKNARYIPLEFDLVNGVYFVEVIDEANNRSVFIIVKEE